MKEKKKKYEKMGQRSEISHDTQKVSRAPRGEISFPLNRVYHLRHDDTTESKGESHVVRLMAEFNNSEEFSISLNFLLLPLHKKVLDIATTTQAHVVLSRTQAAASKSEEISNSCCRALRSTISITLHFPYDKTRCVVLTVLILTYCF